jgi:hypothetical protein
METNSNSAGIRALLSLPAVRLAGLALAALAGSLVGPQAALASFGGANGRIVFNSSRDGAACFPYCGEIYAMAPDGGGQTRLVNNPANDVDPAWSPSGQKIAFTSYRGGVSDVYVMNADGGGQTKLAYGINPAWSPDGTKLVFTSGRQGNFDIYVMNADGSGSTRLTSDPVSDIMPAWSPNGQKIAFVSNRGGANYDIYTMNVDGTTQTKVTATGATEPSWSPVGSRIVFRSLLGHDIYTMNADGSAQAQLTTGGASFDPVWSPDGRKIAYVNNSGGNYEIYTMNADGSGQTDVSNNPAHDFDPDWQPVQYLTPQSASPLVVSLVPLFKQCGTPANPPSGSHSPPLSVSSCPPPAPSSAVARVGSQNQGSGHFSVIPGDGNPANGDQADVSVTASITDVQTTLGGDYNPNASGADMTLAQRFRITDLSNGSSQNDPATTTDFDFRVPVSCSSMPDPAVGSTCSVNTSADSISPDTIRESRRAVFQIFRLRVEDAGEDGVPGNADDKIFAHQGIFVP